MAKYFFTKLFSGQSLPISRHSQTRAKNAGLVTLELLSLEIYHTHKRINKYQIILDG